MFTHSSFYLLRAFFSHSTSEIPMNKIEVGNTPSPNLKKVQSKIGSLDNATHKPGNWVQFKWREVVLMSEFCYRQKGGGNIKIESRKFDIKASSRIETKNSAYVPRGGEKKVSRHVDNLNASLNDPKTLKPSKLCWLMRSWMKSAKTIDRKSSTCVWWSSRIDEQIADLNYKKPKKMGKSRRMRLTLIFFLQMMFQILSQKLTWNAKSKIGSLENASHKPGKKIIHSWKRCFVSLTSQNAVQTHKKA